MQNKNPCFNCEKRKVGCRTACEEWQKYETERFKEYKQRERKMLEFMDLNEYITDAVGRMKRGKKK